MNPLQKAMNKRILEILAGVRSIPDPNNYDKPIFIGLYVDSGQGLLPTVKNTFDPATTLSGFVRVEMERVILTRAESNFYVWSVKCIENIYINNAFYVWHTKTWLTDKLNYNI